MTCPIDNMTFDGMHKSETYVEEAKFAYDLIAPELKKLQSHSRVLEIGAGAGILLNQFAQDHPSLNFLGLEPMGDGFSYDQTYHSLIENTPNAKLLSSGYEGLLPDKKYDLIYLVNVFEHLPDWRDFLNTVKMTLSPNGRCIILCPNYSFPYEPHFQIPIIFNKTVTRKLFSQRIEKFEASEDCHGLWKSLNFVKFRNVVKLSQQMGIDVKFNKTVIEHMISRLDGNPSFEKRQGILRLPIWFARKFGVIEFILRSNITDRWLPYMHLDLSHSGLNSAETS